MIKYIYTFIITAVFFIAVNNASSQWQLANGPYGGNILSIAITDSVIYAGTSALGLYYSPDGGDNWIHTSLNDKPVTCILAYGDEVFAGTSFDGLYYSTDKGMSWQSHTFEDKPVYALLKSGNIIYTGAGNDLYKSTDNGDKWELTSLTGNKVSALAKTSVKLYAACSVGVYSTNLDNEDWKLEKLDDFSPICLCTRNSVVFAGTMTGLYRKLTVGSVWQKTSLNFEWITSIAAAGSNVFAGTSDKGIFISTNLGEKWDITSLKDVKVNSLIVKDSVVYAGITGKPLLKAKIKDVIETLKTGVEYDNNNITELYRNINSIFFDQTNEQLMIDCNIVSGIIARLEIYDILGKRKFGTEIQLSPGKNHIILPGNTAWNPGIYFAALNIPGNGIEIKTFAVAR